VLLEGSNNLLLCESALAHLSSFRLLQNAEDCNLEWTSFRGGRSSGRIKLICGVIGVSIPASAEGFREATRSPRRGSRLPNTAQVSPCRTGQSARMWDNSHQWTPLEAGDLNRPIG